MVIKNNSCPHCGESGGKLQVNESDKDFWMECYNCYARGPMGFSTREAIELWKKKYECKFCGGKEGLISGFGQLVFWGCLIGSFLALVVFNV